MHFDPQTLPEGMQAARPSGTEQMIRALVREGRCLTISESIREPGKYLVELVRFDERGEPVEEWRDTHPQLEAALLRIHRDVETRQ